MIKKLLDRIRPARSIFISPVTEPNPTLQAGIFQQNMGEIPPLQFLIPKNNINQNTSVDTSYLAQTTKGKIEIPDTKDFYIGEGMVE